MHKRSKSKVKQEDHKDDNPRIQSSLPPEVKGQLRCFLAVIVDHVKWLVDNHPKEIQVCLLWWGETGDGTMFWPYHGKKFSNSSTLDNTVLFPVCSGPKQFAAYLKDMSVLVLDVLHSNSLKPFGRVEIHDIVELDGTNPIDKWYPVTSRSVQPVKFADLHVVLKFEPVDVVGQDLSTCLPVIDHNFKHLVDNDEKGGPEKNKHDITQEKSKTIETGRMSSEDVNEDDVIITLIKRGETLINSIVESKSSEGLEAKTEENREKIDLLKEEQLDRSVSGSLFKAILKFEDNTNTFADANISFPTDLLACASDEDDGIELLSTSSVGSESDDPIHDETLLQHLFYVNKDNSVIPTLSESRNCDEDMKKSDPKYMSDKEHNENSTAEKKPGTEVESETVREKKEPIHEKIDNTNRDHISLSENKPLISDNMPSQDFITYLGVDKLTALGRVTAARVHINKLSVLGDFIQIDKHKKRTYFIEYEFPVAASTDYGSESDKNDVGLEITRIATKKTTPQSVLFNHHSVFPVHFDSTIVRFWYDYELKINLFERKSGQKAPILIGYGKIGLLSVLTSENLQYDDVVKIKVCSKQEKNGRSCQSSSSEGSLLGDLEIKIYLMSNGKDLHYHAPSAMEQENVSSEINTRAGNLKDRFTPDIKDAQRVETEQIPPQVHITRKEIPLSTNHRDSVALTTLFWVSEGRNIVSSGHGLSVSVPGSATRSNFYLISRMFWTTDTSRSAICWGQHDPKFNFRQIFPVLLTSALLDRMHNNFLTLEVWSKTGGTQEDELIGIAKIALQQLYLSYKEEQTTKALLKSKFPVIGIDGWINIGNPFKGSSHGELHVLLAMGSDHQINRLLDIKQCSDQDDYFKRSKDRLESDCNISRKHSQEKHVEHWFEISVQNVRKMSAFEKASLSETDCFVQYNFPYQKPDADVDMSIDLSRDVPGLQNHRTATTLCIPETNFNDVARYRIVLPRSLPVQRFLLAAFHGSWSGTGMSSALTFELWKRYYYPNIRDQLFAKAILPLSKLCGMVTMQKQGETSIQSFCLPLTTLPNPAESTKSEPGGHLDINIKYRQSKLVIPHSHQDDKNIADVNTQVCLAIEVIRACGLKCAMSELVKKDSSLTYASDVGGNPYVKIKLPFNIKMNERTTRTIARTFTPEFFYRMEFILPLVLSDNIIGRENQEFSGTLAECLEFGEVVFELWHQRRHESYVEEEIHAVGQGFYQRQLPPTSDVLLGVVKIPLQQLLFSHTGIRGWFPVSSRTLGWSNEESEKNNLDKTVGGLEIVIKLSERKALEKIIESGRAVGWCPPLWYELEDGGWLNDTVDNGIMNVGQGLTFLVNIKKVWIPRSVVTAEQTRQGVKGNKQIGCYIRYKFYDTKAMFSSIRGIKKVKESDKNLCDLKHRHSYLVKTTPPLIWYIREERLEIQVWLTTRHHDDRTALPHKRDKLLGSAFVELFPLLDGSKDFSQISGLYPLFRSSALDLHAAGLHVQLVLQKPSNANQLLEGEIDEDIASTEHSGSAGLQETDSLNIVSGDEEDIQEEVGKYTTKFEEISSLEDDVIMAHVVVEQALHLPLVKTDKNKSVHPNVYVTYQPKLDIKLIKTKIFPSSTSPAWGHEKLVKFTKATISKQVLAFKVWHSQGDSDRHSDEDLLLGLASVDLSPLASGLRQVMGWYNIVDFSGQCQGQVKVGIVPLLSVSPEKALFPHDSEHMSTEIKLDLLRERIDRLPMRPSGIRSDTTNNSVCTLGSTKVPDTSRSLLLRQLRQNLNDLDVIKDKLSQRLIANKEIDGQQEKEPGAVQELVNNLERLNPVNNADPLQSSKTNFALQDVTYAELSTHLDREGHHVSSDHQTTINTNDSNQGTNDEYKELDFHNLFSDVHDYDVNIKELSSDVNHSTNGFDKGTTYVDPSDCDHGDDDHGDDDHGDDDYVCESEVNPVDDNDNNFIGDNSTVGSHSKDLGDDEYHHTDCRLITDKCFIKDKSYEPNLVVNESVQKIIGLDIGNQEDSGDESLDSFFDCVTLRQQKSEPKCGLKLSSDERLNDVVEPESVVSRTNLSKLRNILCKKNKDEQTTSVYEHNANKDKLLRADINIDQSSSNIPCGDPEEISEPRELNMDTSKTSGHFQDEHNKYGTSLKKASIPNFFMPPKDLEQSMRSLRLAATFRKQPKHDNETNREEKMQTVTDEETSRTQRKILTKSLVNWKKVREIRTTGELPLTSDETSRLARIFSSNYSSRK